MEPQLPKPQIGLEGGPRTSPTISSGEVFTVPIQPEAQAAPERSQETREHLSDGPQGDPAAAPIVTPPPMPVLQPAQTAVPADNTSSDTPVAAADEDLIEKEWVEKAKRVVAETRNDPHAQDVAVRNLQADYLKKRYGKVLSGPKEG